MPSTLYSTGSSSVTIFFSEQLSMESTEYNVVVLPEPVGPVTKKNPLGRRINDKKLCSIEPLSPIWSSDNACICRSKIRITIFSPYKDGNVETRKSTILLPWL